MQRKTQFSVSDMLTSNHHSIYKNYKGLLGNTKHTSLLYVSEQNVQQLGSINPKENYFFAESNEVKIIATNFLSEFWSNGNNKQIHMEYQKDRHARHVLKQGPVTPPTISFTLVNIEEKQYCLISTSASLHQYENLLFSALKTFINSYQSQRDVKFILLGQQSQLLNHFLEEDKNRNGQDKEVRVCSEIDIAQALVQLFLKYGKDVYVEASVNCKFYPYTPKTHAYGGSWPLWGQDASDHTVTSPIEHNGYAEKDGFLINFLGCCWGCQQNKYSILRLCWKASEESENKFLHQDQYAEIDEEKEECAIPQDVKIKPCTTVFKPNYSMRAVAKQLKESQGLYYYLNMAKEHYTNGEFITALEAADRQPIQAEIFATLAVCKAQCYTGLGQYEKALDVFSKSIHGCIDNTKTTFYFSAWAQFWITCYEKNIQINNLDPLVELKKALDQIPNNTRITKHMYASYYFKNGDYFEAGKICKQLLSTEYQDDRFCQKIKVLQMMIRRKSPPDLLRAIKKLESKKPAEKTLTLEKEKPAEDIKKVEAVVPVKKLKHKVDKMDYEFEEIKLAPAAHTPKRKVKGTYVPPKMFKKVQVEQAKKQTAPVALEKKSSCNRFTLFVMTAIAAGVYASVSAATILNKKANHSI